MSLQLKRPGRFYLVAFRSSTAWWARLLKPGFGHCALVQWDGRCVLWAERVVEGFRLQNLDPALTPSQCAAALQAIGWRTVLVHERAQSRTSPISCLTPLTCVGFVQDLVGLRTKVWTPQGLYKALKNNQP